MQLAEVKKNGYFQNIVTREIYEIKYDENRKIVIDKKNEKKIEKEIGHIEVCPMLWM